MQDKLLIQQTLRIPIDLYMNIVRYHHELSEDYTRKVEPVVFPVLIPDAIISAYDDVKAKQKLT